MYRINKDTILSTEEIQAYIDAHEITDFPRLQKLYDYYTGNHEILNRTMKDSSKPNNKLIHQLPKYITTVHTGYFIGKPVTYSATDEGAELLDNLKYVFDENDEQALNAEIANSCSIYGKAYEMLYIDEDKEVRSAILDTRYVIPLYSNTIQSELIAVIRYYYEQGILDDEPTLYVEYYNRETINQYQKIGDKLALIASNPHFIAALPIVEYRNNKECSGDFEGVISLVDAYEKINSDSLNDFEAFVDSYLVLSGMQGTEPSEIQAMKENRVLLPPDGASANWLTKQVQDAHVENMKNRLAKEILKLSATPDMGDEAFGGNLSGIAIKYKLMMLESQTSTTERWFKKGLQQRIYLICSIFKLLGADYDYRTIKIAFNRNIPANATEAATLINTLRGIISNQTALEQLPFIDDVQAEVERIEAEAAMTGFDITAGGDTVEE